MKQSQFLEILSMAEDVSNSSVTILDNEHGYYCYLQIGNHEYTLETARGEARSFKRLEPLISLLRQAYSGRIVII